MDLYLELPIDHEKKFTISNKETKTIDDDQVYFKLFIRGREVFSFKDSFAFEIGDILYRWLNEDNREIDYKGNDFIFDFISSEEKWDKEVLLGSQIGEKSEYSKYWLFSAYDKDIFSYSNGDRRYLLVTKGIFENKENTIILNEEISEKVLVLWRSIFKEEYLFRLERERKIIGG